MGLRVNFNAFLPEPLTPVQQATWEAIDAGSRVVELCESGIVEERRQAAVQRQAEAAARCVADDVNLHAGRLKFGSVE